VNYLQLWNVNNIYRYVDNPSVTDAVHNCYLNFSGQFTRLVGWLEFNDAFNTM